MIYHSPSIIPKIGELLREPLPTTRNDLLTHVAALTSLQFELADQLTSWIQLLHEKRAQLLRPREKDITELDRKTYMDANVGVIEKDREFLQEITVITNQRLELAKIILTLEDTSRK